MIATQDELAGAVLDSQHQDLGGSRGGGPHRFHSLSVEAHDDNHGPETARLHRVTQLGSLDGELQARLVGENPGESARRELAEAVASDCSDLEALSCVDLPAGTQQARGVDGGLGDSSVSEVEALPVVGTEVLGEGSDEGRSAVLVEDAAGVDGVDALAGKRDGSARGGHGCGSLGRRERCWGDD
jgi:hypothetical protein